MTSIDSRGTDGRIGTVLAGRYRLLRLIAEGGMGAIYEAVTVDGSERVAVKCLQPHLKDRTDIERRFRREAAAVAALDHPGIVRLRDFGEAEDGSVYMALELLEGRDLAAEMAATGPMAVGRIVRIIESICEALEAAHAKGIVHRDLKPENVFLARDEQGREQVKVLDFGISKFLEQDAGVTAMTKTGTTVGTPYYMAPEQAQGKRDIDRRVDVYALGVILFKALTGQHPFDDESYPMLILKICTEPPPPLLRYRSDVPDELGAVLARALSKDPDDRPGTAVELSAALGQFRNHDATPSMIDAPTTLSVKARALVQVGHGRIDSPLANAATAPLSPAHRPWQSGPGVGADVGSDAEPIADDDAGATGRAGRGPGPMRYFLLLLAVLTVGLLAASALLYDGDEPVTRSNLPEPGPPVSRALRVNQGTGVGWRWVNPLPRAMPGYYGADVTAGGLVAMVGRFGEAARFAGGVLVRWPTGSEETLRGVSWLGAREAIVVGDGGTLGLLATDGRPPRLLPTGTQKSLRAVAAAASTVALAVGDGGVLLRVVDERVEAIDSGTREDLLAVHVGGGDGQADAAWVVGGKGTILRLVGERVSPERSGTEVALRAVGGCGGPVYAAGDEGRILRRTPEGEWRPVTVDGREPWSGIGCDRGRVVVVGQRGTVLLVSGYESVALDSGTDRSLFGVASGHGAPTWIVGDGGRLLRLEEDHLELLTAGPTAPIRDLSTLGGALVAVGEWGRILREREDGLAQTQSPTASALAALVPVADDRLVAVGDYGAVVEITWEESKLLTSPTEESLRDVIGGGGMITAVGTGGTIVRGPPSALEASHVQDVGDLWGIAGTVDDAVIVGEGGVVLFARTSGIQRQLCEPAVTLRSVLRTESGTWAVGDEGVIVRIEVGSCVLEHRGGRRFSGIGVGPYGKPLAVGDAGVAVERDEAGAWNPVDTDVGRLDLRGIARTDRDVYVVGASGIILRHVLLDGT